MRRLRTLALGSSVALLALTACRTDESSGSVQPIDAIAAESSATAADDVTTATVAAANAAASTDAASTTATATATAQDWDTAAEVLVALTGDGAEVSGADVSGVDVEGSFVEITAPGTYRLTGTLADGNVEIDSEIDGLVRIVLDGVDITSSTTSPLAVVKATDLMTEVPASMPMRTPSLMPPRRHAPVRPRSPDRRCGDRRPPHSAPCPRRSSP